LVNFLTGVSRPDRQWPESMADKIGIQVDEKKVNLVIVLFVVHLFLLQLDRFLLRIYVNLFYRIVGLFTFMSFEFGCLCQ
jgi:hypothetical protein